MIAAPEAIAAAATDLASIGSTIGAANAAAAANTTAVLAAGADQVSVAIAAAFGAHGQAYQALSAQAATFHIQFVQALTAGAGSYAAAEAASAASITSPLLDAINAPFLAALGRPLIGNGADGAPGTGAVIQMSQVQPTHQGMVIIEAPFQRPLQIGDLRAHTAARQISQHRRAAFTVDERLHHRPHRLGGDRGRHAVGLDPGVLKHIAQALQLRGAMLDQLAAVADHVAGGLDVGGRNQPTPQQTAFQQVHQPLGIQEVGFAARPFFTCPALHTSSSLAVGQQRVISGRTSAHHVLLRLPARPTPAVAGRSPWPAAWRIGIRAS